MSSTSSVRPDRSLGLPELVAGCVGRPVAIEGIDTRPKSLVYLVRGTEATAVVKVGAEVRLRRELFVYEEVLPTLALAGPQVLGWDVEGDRASIVLEHLQGERPDLQDPRERQDLSRWVARLHVASRRCTLELPAPAPILARPEPRLDELEGALAQRGLDARNATSLLGGCEALRSRLPMVLAAAGALAPAFAHLDLSAQNLLRGSYGLVAFDWERSGWTSPAVDLAWVDLGAYASECDGLGQPAGADVLHRGALAGRVLADLLHNLGRKGFASQKRYLRRMLETSDALLAGANEGSGR